MADRFSQRGFELVTPALDAGDFEHLTITGQLRFIDEIVGGQPTVLIGSSLGGYLAGLYASNHPEIERLVLLAPAFDFAVRWMTQLGPERMEHWRTTRKLAVYHYALQRDAQLDYGFCEDWLNYPAIPRFSQPALLLHGTLDEVVPAASSEQFAAANPNARLRLFSSGHELTDVLEPLWEEIERFLALGVSTKF